MAEIGIFVGTVYGNALLVAEEAASQLESAGHQTKVFEDPRLNDWQAYQNKIALIVTSTTGQGDLPDSIASLYHEINDKMGQQTDVRYGLIVLGDSSYDRFCAGGLQFDALLQAQQAQRIGDVLTIDAMEHPEPEIVSERWIATWVSQL